MERGGSPERKSRTGCSTNVDPHSVRDDQNSSSGRSEFDEATAPRRSFGFVQRFNSPIADGAFATTVAGSAARQSVPLWPEQRPLAAPPTPLGGDHEPRHGRRVLKSHHMTSAGFDDAAGDHIEILLALGVEA